MNTLVAYFIECSTILFQIFATFSKHSGTFHALGYVQIQCYYRNDHCFNETLYRALVVESPFWLVEMFEIFYTCIVTVAHSDHVPTRHTVLCTNCD